MKPVWSSPAAKAGCSHDARSRARLVTTPSTTVRRSASRMRSIASARSRPQVTIFERSGS